MRSKKSSTSSIAVGRKPGPRPRLRYRARPRFRRRRSAGLSFRGFVRCLDPALRPSARPAPAVAARPRTGARRRASRQMKNEIAHSRMPAPATITIALDPLRPLPLDEVLVVVTAGVVVVVGTVACDCGIPGVIGFPSGFEPGAPLRAGLGAVLVPAAPVLAPPPAAIATAGNPPANHARTPATAAPRTAAPNLPDTPDIAVVTSYRSGASGCSIAGVPGASRYGCSGSTSSSW